MSDSLPQVYLARHGETEWSITGQHTGLTDLPLTKRGEWNARSLGQLIGMRSFARVFTSPLLRTRQTCELAGFGDKAELDPDLVEWNYGEYEGRTTAEIRRERPGWQLFIDGCPGGESVAQVTARADRVVARLRAIDADVLLFSSGHFSRVLAVRWLDWETVRGMQLVLSTATLSILGYDHGRDEPAIRLWNDDRHCASGGAHCP